jgi:adenylate kinase
MPNIYIFYGRSGAGKGTQADLLKKYLEQTDSEHATLHFETGGAFREFIKKDNYTTGLIKKTLDVGGLLPEFLPIWIWTQFFIDNFTGKENIILDGVARRMPEAPVLDSALKYYNFQKVFIIYLNVSRECVTERMKKRGRHDDTEENIKERLDWYEENVVPVVDYFRNNDRNTFLDVDGEPAIEEIHKEIISKIS